MFKYTGHNKKKKQRIQFSNQSIVRSEKYLDRNVSLFDIRDLRCSEVCNVQNLSVVENEI